MPTLILLDVSLSMSRPVNMQECSEEYQRRHLAIHGINTLLDYMAANCKLEFTSLVILCFFFFFFFFLVLFFLFHHFYFL